MQIVETSRQQSTLDKEAKGQSGCGARQTYKNADSRVGTRLK
jgi:hypothetical protein